MKNILRIVAGLLFIVIVLLVISLIYTSTVISSPTDPDKSILIIAMGVFMAMLTLISNIYRQASEGYLRSASDLLKQAYEVLSDMDENGRPKNDRMKWLAAARFLRASENVSKLITEDSHKVIDRAQKEYWRSRLRDLIFPNAADMKGFPEDYYAEKPEHMFVRLDKDRAPLSIHSLAVLYRFIRWPKGFDDPIKDEPKFTEEEIEEMQISGPTGLGSLLAKIEKLRKDEKKSGRG